MVPKRAAESRLDLVSALREGRARTLELVADLTDEQMMGPRLAIVNPLLWELGHIAYFQEYWLLRKGRSAPPIRPDADSLYDSARIPHDTRWDLPLPSRADTLAYMEHVLENIASEPEQLRPSPDAGLNGYDEAYFIRLGLLHEYMHAEAFTYTRQTLSYPAPTISIANAPASSALDCAAPAQESTQPQRTNTARSILGDADVPGGVFSLGSTPDAPFAFDNEQWAHPVTVKPFKISRTAVSNEEFLAFVEDRGYERREFWTDEGWRWREDAETRHPVYWKGESAGRWLRRNFDRWLPLEASLPVLHVNWFEADAYCRWAGRRLPSEAEWEMAASAEPRLREHGLTTHKRDYAWGSTLPSPDRANLDWRNMGCIPVDALPTGDSAFGCRQMIGNVWEWTATDFAPYPGFAPGPYKEYSAPWFGNHKVLRGGCWATRSGLIRNTYRNFYQPHRRDVWAGFRTCAA